MVAALEDEAGGLADPECEIGRDRAVGTSANAVGPEILAHGPYSRLSGFLYSNPMQDWYRSVANR